MNVQLYATIHNNSIYIVIASKLFWIDYFLSRLLTYPSSLVLPAQDSCPASSSFSEARQFEQ